MVRQGNNDRDDIIESRGMAQISQEYEAGAGSLEEVTQDSEEDQLTRSLANRLSDFQSRSLPDICIEDLIFCKPSTEDDPSIPPALQSHAETNAQYLEYRSRIIDLYLDTSSLECNRFERCKILKNQLLDELRIEWDKLDELKLRAWQVAAKNSPSVPLCSDPDLMDFESMQVIDTCGCPGSFSSTAFMHTDTRSNF